MHHRCSFTLALPTTYARIILGSRLLHMPQAVDYCEVFRNMHIKHEQNQVGGSAWVPVRVAGCTQWAPALPTLSAQQA